MLPPNMREQLGGPIVLPSAYLRHAVGSLQVSLPGPSKGARRLAASGADGGGGAPRNIGLPPSWVAGWMSDGWHGISPRCACLRGHAHTFRILGFRRNTKTMNPKI